MNKRRTQQQEEAYQRAMNEASRAVLAEIARPPRKPRGVTFSLGTPGKLPVVLALALLDASLITWAAARVSYL